MNDSTISVGKDFKYFSDSLLMELTHLFSESIFKIIIY